MSDFVNDSDKKTFDPKKTHRVWSLVPITTYYDLIRRAKGEDLYTDSNGHVDVGKVVHHLIQNYANGNMIFRK